MRLSKKYGAIVIASATIACLAYWASEKNAEKPAVSHIPSTQEVPQTSQLATPAPTETLNAAAELVAKSRVAPQSAVEIEKLRQDIEESRHDLDAATNTLAKDTAVLRATQHQLAQLILGHAAQSEIDRLNSQVDDQIKDAKAAQEALLQTYKIFANSAQAKVDRQLANKK